MSQSEMASLGISLISVVIALVSLVRTRKVENEQLELQRITADLSRKQIRQLDEQDQLQNRADLRVRFEPKSQSDWIFVIENRGSGSAFSLKLELLNCTKSPLEGGVSFVQLQGEVKSHDEARIPAHIPLNGDIGYDVRLAWKERGGTERSEDYAVSMRDAW